MVRYTALPTGLAFAAPESWEVDWSGSRPKIEEAQMKELVFGVLRELLCPTDLMGLYTYAEHTFWEKDQAPEWCLLSVRGGGARVLTATREVRRGRQTVFEHEHQERRSQKLNNCELEEWLLGTRLKFQDGRWYVAPPAVAADEREELKEEIIALENDQHNDQASLQHLRQRLSHIKQPVYTAVSRLLCYHKHKHPNAVAAFARTPINKVLAVHYQCDGSRAARARCLNAMHICWGDDLDNAYHRVVHGTLADPVVLPQYCHPARKRRPATWEPPSDLDGFVCERKRLRDRGSRKLYFLE